MAKTTAAKEALAVAYSQKALFATLHTADPGTTGASVVGSRVAITWTTGTSDGSVSGTASIPVAASTTVTYAGFWDASTAGNFIDGGALPAGYTGAGTYNLTVTYTEN